MTDPKRLYEEDFAFWAQQQAEALRAVAQGGSNQTLDWMAAHDPPRQDTGGKAPRRESEPEGGAGPARRGGNKARHRACVADLEEHGDLDEVEANVLRRARYIPEQVLGDWFPPEPARE